MQDVTLGVFKRRQDAEQAIRELEAEGFSTTGISVLMQESADAREVAAETGAQVAGGAVSGAATGGVIGGLAGLLIGVGAITIPGIGALLIGGPLAAALGLTGAAATTASGAMTGAAAGGLIGGLVGLGLPKETAEAYEGYIREGGVVIAVPDMNDDEVDASEILEENNAERVDRVSM